MGGFTVDGLKARGIHLVSLKERLNTSSAAAREIIGFSTLAGCLRKWRTAIAQTTAGRASLRRLRCG